MSSRSRGSPKKANEAGKTIEGFQVSTAPGRNTPDPKGSRSPKTKQQRNRNHFNSLITDKEISRKGPRQHERELVHWAPNGKSSESWELDGGLESSQSKSNDKEWDQFAANEKLYGVRTTYDENVYTTKLDKTKATISEAEAERIAREIQGKGSSNPHIREERNMEYVEDHDQDEEARYSAVQGRRVSDNTQGTQVVKGPRDAKGPQKEDGAQSKFATNNPQSVPVPNGTPAWSNPAQSVAAVTNRSTRPQSSLPVDMVQQNKDYRQVVSELNNYGGSKRDKASPSGSKTRLSPSDSSFKSHMMDKHVEALDLHVVQPKLTSKDRRDFNEFKRANKVSQSPSESFQGALSSLSLSRASSSVNENLQRRQVEVPPPSSAEQNEASPSANDGTQPQPSLSQTEASSPTIQKSQDPATSQIQQPAKLSTQAPPATQANAQSKFKFNPNASEFVPLAKKSPVASVHQSPQSSRSGTPKAGTGNRRTQFNNRSQGNRQTRNATKLGRTMEGWPSGSRPHYPLPPSQPQGLRSFEPNDQQYPATHFPGHHEHPASYGVAPFPEAGYNSGFPTQAPVQQIPKPSDFMGYQLGRPQAYPYYPGQLAGYPQLPTSQFYMNPTRPIFYQ